MVLEKQLSLTIVIVGVMGIVLVGTVTILSGNDIQAQQQNSKTIRVAAGGGNATAPLTVFVPEKVEIKTGESVVWDNPTTVAEPHTVTFVLENKTMTNIVSPFTVIPNSTRFETIPPNSNNEPLKAPGPSNNNVVIAVNARTYIPTVIDSQGSAKHLPPPNAAYTIDGNEKYVNSGWLLPKGQEQAFPGSSTTFTVTFQKAGIYNYLCILHPWMTGSVIVK